MVEGSTRKLYRQKGTGNARAGTRRTIVRKGGGVAFAKTQSRDFRLDMPKKMRRLANRNALLAKLVDNEVKCIDSLDFDSPRTRDFKAMLEAVGIDRTCLVALTPKNRNAALSARNLPNVDTIRVEQLNAFELLNHRYLVVDKAALESFLDGTRVAAARPPGEGGRVMEATDIVIKPLITEKATFHSAEFNRYAFQVDRRATKEQIKQAVRGALQGAGVGVATQNRKGRMRRNRYGFWQTKDIKRAIVKVHPDDRIELF